MSKYMFVIPSLSKGGAEKVVCVLSSAIAREGEEMVVVKYYDTKDEYLISDKVKVINLSGGDVSAYNKISGAKRIGLLRKIIKEEKPDFIVPFLFLVALCTELATVGIKTNVYKTVRIDPATGPAVKWQRVMRDLFVKTSKCTFVQNEKQKMYFPKRIHDKIHILPNPVSAEFFDCKSNFERETFTVVGAGRLSEQKNFKLLIDSFVDALGDKDNVQLQIYGDGELKDQLQEYINILGKADVIKLMGRTNDLKTVFENTDVFVLSSFFEGMPNALIEAMAAGVPCVSTDCPTGPSDLIENNKNGILVPVDDRESMANAIKTIYNKEVDVQSMSKLARAKILDVCSAEKLAQRMIKICEESR